jgi:ribonuclease P protein component
VCAENRPAPDDSDFCSRPNDSTGEPLAGVFTFRARHRLTHAREFAAVFEQGVKRYRGPITLLALPNGRAEARLGLSISGRVGNAVTRNRLKRLLREAFRLERAGFPMAPARPGEPSGPDVPPCSYDLVLTSRPHALLPLSGYRRLLAELVGEAHRTWKSKVSRADARPGTTERSA